MPISPPSAPVPRRARLEMPVPPYHLCDLCPKPILTSFNVRILAAKKGRRINAGLEQSALDTHTFPRHPLKAGDNLLADNYHSSLRASPNLLNIRKRSFDTQTAEEGSGSFSRYQNRTLNHMQQMLTTVNLHTLPLRVSKNIISKLQIILIFIIKHSKPTYYHLQSSL